MRRVPRVGTLFIAARYAGTTKAPDALEPDTTDAFFQKHMTRALEKNRVSKEAANYFMANMNAMPEMRESLKKAQQHIGDQDPERFTSFQQQMFNDNMSRHVSDMGSKKMQDMFQEQEATKAYTEEGRRTGENYWFEEGALLSQDLPGELKDDILDEMKKERGPDSPAALK